MKGPVEQLLGIVNLLANADPEDRKTVYRDRNLSVVHHDRGRVEVSAAPDARTSKSVGGASVSPTPQAESDWIDVSLLLKNS